MNIINENITIQYMLDMSYSCFNFAIKNEFLYLDTEIKEFISFLLP